MHKKLRDKRIAPILIQEVTRQVHLTNRWQAVYTAGKLLPRPVAICRYYHRSLNPKKLVEVGFSGLGPRSTMSMQVKLYRVPTVCLLDLYIYIIQYIFNSFFDTV